MNNIANYLLILLTLAVPVWARTQASEYYANVERHLRSLPSLEIGYRATGSDFPEEGLEGRLVFRRPDAFYHDTPEWTHCEIGSIQWRLLKEQETLMIEDAQGRSEWSPEAVLLSLDRELVPYDLLAEGEGDTLLVLDAASPQVSGQVEMLFAGKTRVPKEIRFVGDDGIGSKYEILMWHESVALDTSLFALPAVPEENLIDFRTR
ncbi:MAG: hypothetical protein H6508_06760 [Calditrichaeota bacterium]|nr:hypothetical protein [Calditrichota bacterium]MCB9366858.1 hypothetical protein [Calditrichota bacterium]